MGKFPGILFGFMHEFFEKRMVMITFDDSGTLKTKYINRLLKQLLCSKNLASSLNRGIVGTQNANAVQKGRKQHYSTF